MNQMLLVFVGGGLGSLCRWGISLALQPLLPRFPWATLVANGLACFVTGILLNLQMGHGLIEQRRLLLAVGFCGGFSTFSTFTAETFQLWQSGHQTLAFANMFGSLLLCFACLFLGLSVKSL